MMEDLDDENRGLKAINVNLQSDPALLVDISDALSEWNKVKFTVHTKSLFPNFKQNEFSVVQQREQFIWLHDSFVKNEDYAGYIIPPAPPRADFDASREKVQKLGEGEGSMTKEEFTKMKQEVEAGYLGISKNTVVMHEVFLCHVTAHPILRKYLNFHVFLEYNQDLNFFKNMVKSADGVIVSRVKDVDNFFEHEQTFLLEYHNRDKDASRIGSSLYALGTWDSTDICKFFLKVSEIETQAAKDLLSLVDYENANKALDKARAKNKDVLLAKTSQQLCSQKFEKKKKISKHCCIQKKKLVELAELELKHAKGNLQLLPNCLAVLNGDT
uniref:PX domain-containing protein n=1 Tax=Pan troglodytes TaxID=9598 RepID=A0A2I3RAS9_PANTR